MVLFSYLLKLHFINILYLIINIIQTNLDRYLARLVDPVTTQDPGSLFEFEVEPEVIAGAVGFAVAGQMTGLAVSTSARCGLTGGTGPVCSVAGSLTPESG